MSAPPAPASSPPDGATAAAHTGTERAGTVAVATLPDGAERTLGDRLVIVIPPVLLTLSTLLGILVPREAVVPHDGLWALLPAAVLLVMRPVLERALTATGPDSRVLRGLYALHLLTLVAGVVLNPYLCIYAFVGYLDGERLLAGARTHLILVLTALISAGGQAGGLLVILHAPWLYVLLAAVNLLLAGAMSRVSRERGVVLDARERALEELARSQRENARLHEELLERARLSGVEQERTRLSREIHDTVAQGLVGVIRQLEAVGPDIDEDSRRRVSTAEETARDALLEARRAVEALSPHQLGVDDLPDALGVLVARWARAHRIVATVDADEADPHGPHAEVLLRIAQEALANVARHARAGSVALTLSGGEGQQLLRIVDDGVGADLASVSRGHGLGNMRARARAVGGELTVVSRPGHGLAVTARVPA
jgi:signal transduction histidine kinase